MTIISKRSIFSLAYYRSFIKFVIVGAMGVGVNEGLLILMQSMGVYLLYAGAIAIEVSIISNFILNDQWTFKDRRSGKVTVRLVKFNTLMLAGLVINLAILDVGTVYFSIHYAIANLIGIAAAFFVRYALSVKYAWMRIPRVEEGKMAPVPEALAGQQKTGS